MRSVNVLKWIWTILQYLQELKLKRIFLLLVLPCFTTRYLHLHLHLLPSPHGVFFFSLFVLSFSFSLFFFLLFLKLKPDATPTITALKQGNIPSIIITGDNVYTAVHVARQSGIVSPTTDIFIGDVSVAPKSSGKADTKLINLEGDSFKQNVTFRHFDHDHCTLDTATGKLVSDKGSNLDFLSEGNGNSEKSGMMSQVSIRPDGYYLNTDNVVYALTAPAFEEIQSRGAAGISFLNEKVVVYARMKPIQKEMVINMLKENKKIVGKFKDNFLKKRQKFTEGN
jgi:magnesium-transporting ATPase (P-type)